MEDRTVRSFKEALEKNPDAPPPPETVAGDKGAVLAAQLEEVMKLPAADSAVFKFAHAGKLSDKIKEHMDSGDPELETHAMDVSAKLISSVVKAQKNQGGNVTINTQINTGNVPIAGTPGNLRPRPAYFSKPLAEGDHIVPYKDNGNSPHSLASRRSTVQTNGASTSPSQGPAHQQPESSSQSVSPDGSSSASADSSEASEPTT